MHANKKHMGSGFDRQAPQRMAITSIERPPSAHYNSSMINPGSLFRTWSLCWFLALGFLINSCSRYLPPIPTQVRPPAEDEETRISREFRREARKHLRFVSHPEVERYLDRIGRRIVSATGPQPFEYRFYVVEDSQLNAFAVPGGSIFFYTGLLERAKTTAEIAGVMGHEIVHIKARHMARSSGPDAVSLLTLLSTVLLARSGGGAQAAGTIGQALAATRQIAYSRQLEMEADTLGARYMASAGYDPNGALGFLKMMDRERSLNPIDLPPYLMTHPITQERVANIELVLKSLPKAEHSTEKFDPLKRVQLILRAERHEGDAIVNEYQKRAKENSQDSEILQLLALGQQLKGQFSQARKNYEKARALSPDNSGLQRDLARLYSTIGEVALSRSAFETALALDPNEPLTYLYLGEHFEKYGDLRSAAGAYLNAHNLAPLWDKPPHRLGLVYGQLNRLGDAHYYLGRSYLLQDDEERAIVEYEKALKNQGEASFRGQAIHEELKTLKARKR
jgi:predicted Zn-dependent protease